VKLLPFPCWKSRHEARAIFLHTFASDLMLQFQQCLTDLRANSKAIPLFSDSFHCNSGASTRQLSKEKLNTILQIYTGLSSNKYAKIQILPMDWHFQRWTVPYLITNPHSQILNWFDDLTARLWTLEKVIPLKGIPAFLIGTSILKNLYPVTIFESYQMF
jgi:hypothetical protein